jgi:hypothetical protein
MKSYFLFIVLIFIMTWVSYDVYLSAASVKRSLCSTDLIELMGRKVTPRRTLNALYAQVGGQLTHAQCRWSILWNQKNDNLQDLSNRPSVPLIMTQDNIRQDLHVVWSIATKAERHPLVILWEQKYKNIKSSNLETNDFKDHNQPKTDQVKLVMDRWQRLCFSLSSDLTFAIEDRSKSKQVFYCFPH